MALLGSIKPSLSLLVTQVFTQVLTFVKLINLKFKMSAFYRKCVLLKDSIYLCTWSPLSKPSSSRVQLAHTPALLGVSTPKYPKGGWLSFSEKRERGGVERARALEAAQAPLCLRHLPTLRISAATRPP